MADTVFKNLQVIKGTTVNQFMETMGFFTASLGADCTFCHVNESNGNWAKYADDNARKRIARRMVTMVEGHQQDQLRRPAGGHLLHVSSRRQPAAGDGEPGEAVRRRPSRRGAGRRDRAGSGGAVRGLDSRSVHQGPRWNRAAGEAHQLRREGHVPGLRRSREASGGRVRQGAEAARDDRPRVGRRQQHRLRQRRGVARGAHHRASGDRCRR